MIQLSAHALRKSLLDPGTRKAMVPFTYVLAIFLFFSPSRIVSDLHILCQLQESSDLKVEFFHLVTFLLSHCTCKWKQPTDKVRSIAAVDR